MQCAQRSSITAEVVLRCGHWQQRAAAVETKQQADVQRYKLLVLI